MIGFYFHSYILGLVYDKVMTNLRTFYQSKDDDYYNMAQSLEHVTTEQLDLPKEFR